MKARLISMFGQWACVSCVAFMALGAFACDRAGVSDEPESSQTQSAEAAQKVSSQGPASIDSDFEPSVPAAWDSTDPEGELEGREALLTTLTTSENVLGPLTWDDRLQAATESHAAYIKDNKAAIDASGQYSCPRPALPGFTGNQCRPW